MVKSASDLFFGGGDNSGEQTDIRTYTDIPGVEFGIRIRKLEIVDILSEVGFIPFDLLSEVAKQAQAIATDERGTNAQAQAKMQAQMVAAYKDPEKFLSLLECAVVRGIVALIKPDGTDFPVEIDRDALRNDEANGVISLGRFKQMHAGALYVWAGTQVLEYSQMGDRAIADLKSDYQQMGAGSRANSSRVRGKAKQSTGFAKQASPSPTS